MNLPHRRFSWLLNPGERKVLDEWVKKLTAGLRREQNKGNYEAIADGHLALEDGTSDDKGQPSCASASSKTPVKAPRPCQMTAEATESSTPVATAKVTEKAAKSRGSKITCSVSARSSRSFIVFFARHA